MKYVVAPLRTCTSAIDPAIVDFGPGSSVLLLARPSRSGRTEIINVMCELLAGPRAGEDSRPDRRHPWANRATVMGYTDDGALDFHAIRYENSVAIEAASGDLPDASLCVLGYSSTDRCGWYHAGRPLSISGSPTNDWSGLVQALGLLASIEDGSFRMVLNECLVAAGLPELVGASCLRHAVYAAEFKRPEESRYLSVGLLTRTEKAGIMQVCSQVIPWLLHARACSTQGVPPMEICYCLIDDVVSGLDLQAVSAVMQRRFPVNRFVTLGFT